MIVMDALSLLIDDEVQRYLDYYRECFSVAIAFYDPAGRSLRSAQEKSLCHYCHLLRTDPAQEKRCLALDQKKREEAALVRETLLYRCHGGLWEALRAVRVDGILLGFLMVGQIRGGEPFPDAAKNHPRRVELYRAHSRMVVHAKLAPMIGLFDALTEFMVQKNFLKIRTNLLVSRLLGFIDANLDRPLSLADGAGHVNMTPSALAHALKRQGIGPFGHLVRQRKMAEARRILTARPDLTVKEAALSLGYDDPYYFSRVYKQVHRVSPSQDRGQPRL